MLPITELALEAAHEGRDIQDSPFAVGSDWLDRRQFPLAGLM